MDFLSIVLAALGWNRDRSLQISDRRIEAYRLNSEVATDAMRAVNVLAIAAPAIMRRLQALYPDQPELHQSCSVTLTTMRTQAEQIFATAESNKVSTGKASKGIDWDTLVARLHGWRATASMLCPEAESLIRRYEDALTREEQARSLAGPQPAAPRPRDRGWDAPPL